MEVRGRFVLSRGRSVQSRSICPDRPQFEQRAEEEEHADDDDDEEEEELEAVVEREDFAGRKGALCS